MTLSDLTSVEAVRQAASEVLRLGRQQFLERYGYSKSTKYLALVDGIAFDSKPLLSFAYSIQFPERGRLPTSSFSGGNQTGQTLKRLGFKLIPVSAYHHPIDAEPPGMDTSWRANKVALERSLVSEFQRAARKPLSVTKVEQSLVDEFLVCQSGKGRTFVRWEIMPTGSSDRLLTDIYDEETRTLFEAKASAGRPDIRLGLGQILDYSRFIEECEALALLLPARPTGELLDLLHTFEVRAVWRARQGLFEASHESIYLG